MRISDWSSDVCSSDLTLLRDGFLGSHGADPFDTYSLGVLKRERGAVDHAAALRHEISVRLEHTALNAQAGDVTEGPAVERSSEERRVGKESVSTCRSR